jgi:two-component system sensor histidine kinase KdpD
MLLRDLGSATRLTVYLASAPGAGKTRRLLDDANRLLADGVRVTIGWIETKGRPDLDALRARVPALPPRAAERSGSTFFEFDLDAALAAKPQVVILDELAHANLPGGRNAKRWQDALALRDAGISVIGALNVMHLETVAPIAERLIGYPVREIVPMSFLRSADQVISLDVSAEELIARLSDGRIVRAEDIERSRNGLFRPQTLSAMRELMLRTIDDLTIPQVEPEKTSSALAFVTPRVDAAAYLGRVREIADVLDMRVEAAPVGEVDREVMARAAASAGADVIALDRFDPQRPDVDTIKAAMIVVPNGKLAARLAEGPIDRDILVLDPALLKHQAEQHVGRGRLSQFAGDRMRVGYGRLTIYIGSAAGSGKTYAMLGRAHRLRESGVDTVAAFVETHGRADTEKMLEGLEVIPRRRIERDGMVRSELDVEATIARRPAVALVDELAHTNVAGDVHRKRYSDVLQLLRSGISVMTTLNVQHLEGLNDAVFRLTGTRVRETLPDEIVMNADEVVFIDVTPDVLRERLRQGKIYPPERIEAALANFFRSENLAALRELAVREVVRARAAVRKTPPLRRIALGVKARERDIELIERCARLARRFDVDLSVVQVAKEADPPSRTVEALESAARRVHAQWVAASGRDYVKTLIEAAAAAGATTIAVEGSRSKPRWPRRPSFARKLLDAGAAQLLIVTPIGLSERKERPGRG